ncbi:MAG: NAD(P)H-binding protein [Pseudomonadota bacterium]
MPVLVLGGSGHLGRHAVAALLARGQAVRVLTRSAWAARALLGPEPELVEGDLEDPVAVRAAFDGVERAVVAISAFTLGTFRRLGAIERDAVIAALTAGRDQGLRRVVYLSVFAVDGPQAADLETAQVKRAVEAWLAGSGLDWTVLGQPPSTDLFFALIRAGRVLVAPGGGPPALPTISPLDTGALVALAVLRDDLGGRRLRLVGPDRPSFPEVARRIGAAWGRRLRVVKPPLLVFRALHRLSGWLAPRLDLAGYAHLLLGHILLMRRFPQDLAARAGDDHATLRALFPTWEPRPLEDDARRISTPAPAPPRGSSGPGSP